MNYNNIYTVIGARSQGKTPFIIGGDYEQGLAAIYLKKGMSVLIIDEFDHPKYRHIPVMLPKDYSKLSHTVGIYRTLCTVDKMPSLFKELKKVWNTCIVFEDCYKYIPMKLTKDQAVIFGNSKNQNNCLVFMHWCWGFVQPDLFRISNYFIIFKTGDSPEVRETYIKGIYNEILEAHRKIMSTKLYKGKPYIIVASGI